MKKSFLFLFLITLCFSCSEDQDNGFEGNLSLAGQFLTPNGEDPISAARVILLNNETIVKESTTDGEGKFLFSNLAAGEYTVSLIKGLFSASRTANLNIDTDDLDFDIGDIPITDLPNIAVVTGSYDNIETVLYNIGLVNPITEEPLFDIIEGNNIAGRQMEDSHLHGGHSANRTNNPLLEPNVDIDFGDLIESPELLASYDIIFLNCGLNGSKTDFNNNLTDFVFNGGYLYSTDWASSYLSDITNEGEDYIDFYSPAKSGDSQETVAQIFNEDLQDWFTLNFETEIIDNTVLIDQFLNGWEVVDSYNEETVTPWLYGPVEYDNIEENKYLAYTFSHGDGGVLYSSFHTKNSTTQSDAVGRLMQYLVFELSDL
ncbi:MAG: hypothetical protein BM564_07985 [Bacteroidetes bacterium MedPE-SWsnd-G2]|nr:MAG: hypothetical protein BM564_07985 [Bacteroidetes bacterium MedPE-SWsnd-G2]